MKKQLEELKDEERIKKEGQQLKERYAKELEYEMAKEKAKAEKEKTESGNTTVLSKTELARMKYEEELARKERRKREQQEKLDKLYQKMTEQPNTDHRVASPPIPTMRDRNSLSPPIPTLRNRNSSPAVPTLRVQQETVPTNTAPPVSSANMPASLLSANLPSNVPASSRSATVLATAPSTGIPVPQHVGQAPLLHQASLPVVAPTVQPLDHHLISTQTLPAAQKPVQIIPVTQPSQPKGSAEILKNLFDLKTQIKHQATSVTALPGSNQPVHQPPWQSRPIMAFPSRKRDHTQSHASAVPAASALNEFTRLKHRQPSCEEFLKQHPDQPRTNTALEAQQAALLTHQQQQLSKTRGQQSKPCKCYLYNYSILWNLTRTCTCIYHECVPQKGIGCVEFAQQFMIQLIFTDLNSLVSITDDFV